MSPVYIKVDNKEAVAWLARLIGNTIDAGPNHPTMMAAFEQLTAWDEALSNPMTFKQIMDEDEDIQALKAEIRASKTRKTRTKKRVSKKEQKLDEHNPLICTTHPTYTGTRVPRKDCDRCWGVYQKLHPQEYKMKRKAFERTLAKDTKL